MFNNFLERETLNENQCRKHFSLDRRLDGLIFSPIFKFLRFIQSLSLFPPIFSLFLFSSQAVSVCNSTVSINLTITARWISQNRHVLRRGSQFLCSCRECVYTLGRARARISTWIAMNMRLREEK